jgi:hypothetical protein
LFEFEPLFNEEFVLDESSQKGDFIESLSKTLLFAEDGVALIPGDPYKSIGDSVGVLPL